MRRPRNHASGQWIIAHVPRRRLAAKAAPITAATICAIKRVRLAPMVRYPGSAPQQKRPPPRPGSGRAIGGEPAAAGAALHKPGLFLLRQPLG